MPSSENFTVWWQIELGSLTISTLWTMQARSGTPRYLLCEVAPFRPPYCSRDCHMTRDPQTSGSFCHAWRIESPSEQDDAYRKYPSGCFQRCCCVCTGSSRNLSPQSRFSTLFSLTTEVIRMTPAKASPMLKLKTISIPSGRTPT